MQVAYSSGFFFITILREFVDKMAISKLLGLRRDTVIVKSLMLTGAEVELAQVALKVLILLLLLTRFILTEFRHFCVATQRELLLINLRTLLA